MNDGFKGTKVQLIKIEISGAEGALLLRVGVNFLDAEGVVHAQISHNLTALKEDKEPILYEALATLDAELTRRISRIHFNTSLAAGPDKRQVIDGIAEALRGSTDTPDRADEPR